jgi:hypothetical protein
MLNDSRSYDERNSVLSPGTRQSEIEIESQIKNPMASTGESEYSFDTDENSKDKKRYLLMSYYLVAAWAGAPFPFFDKCPSLQKSFDICWFLSVPCFGMVYCMYLIICDGFLQSCMWLFIELGAMGCWTSFFRACRKKNAYHPYANCSLVWNRDLYFVCCAVTLYIVIAGVYFSNFSTLMGELPLYGKIIEGIHGTTSWARYDSYQIS